MIVFVPDYQKTVKVGAQPIWHKYLADEGKRTAVYLHGELERLAGFDIVYLEPGHPTAHFYMPAQGGHQIVKVKMDAGEFKAVLIFWWAQYGIKGLVCGLKDIEAIRYARQHQWNKSWTL